MAIHKLYKQFQFLYTCFGVKVVSISTSLKNTIFFTGLLRRFTPRNDRLKVIARKTPVFRGNPQYKKFSDNILYIHNLKT